MADGDGNFDIQFIFPDSGITGFEAGETSVYYIIDTCNINVLSSLFLVMPGLSKRLYGRYE